MQAARIHAFGGPEVVTYEDVPTPTPKANEVLFKVTSTSMNYADVQWRRGNYVDRTLPATLAARRRASSRPWDLGSQPCRWDSQSWREHLVVMRNSPSRKLTTSSPARPDWT